MRVKCPHCEIGELVKDFRQSYYVIFEKGCGIGNLVEPTNYDPDEMNNEVYCDKCLTFISATEIDKLVNILEKGKTNEN